MPEEIVLDRKTFEALAINTRVSILKALRPRRKTQSELSHELNLAVSTVSEHLEKMVEAGLIKRAQQGKKWVYYELTEKGEHILNPRKTSVFVFALSISALLIVFGGLTLYSTSVAPVFQGAEAPGYKTYGEQDITEAVLNNTSGAPALTSVDVMNETIRAQVLTGFESAENLNYESIAAMLVGMAVLIWAIWWWRRK